MTERQPLGPVLHSFFADHLITVKGLRPASVRSYRDTIRLLLTFAAADKGCKITRLSLGDLSFERIVRFLRYLEQDRRNHIRTRNQRLAALHTLFEYIAGRSPEMLAACQQVAAIPMKRVAPPETRFLDYHSKYANTLQIICTTNLDTLATALYVRTDDILKQSPQLAP